MRERFFIGSASGDGFSLAYHLAREGHAVDFWTREPDARRIGVGFRGSRHAPSLHVVTDPAPARNAVVIFDATGFAPLAERFRRRGLPVIGGNALETWEDQRMDGTRAFAAHGLDVPETREFTRLDDAMRFLAAQDDAAEFYFKPDGRDVPKVLTRKGTAPSLIRFLAWARPQLAKVPRFELQRPVENGTEVDVAVWLDGIKAVAFEVTIEEKKFLAGNIGPATGCQSNLVWDIDAKTQLVAMTIRPFVQPLLDSGYVGIASVNTIITPKLDVYGLEFTMRCGWDSTQAALALFRSGNRGEQLAAFARGELAGFAREHHRAAMTLRLSTSPQPIDDSKDHTKLRGLPLDPRLLADDDFFPDDVMLDRGELVMASGSGHVGVLSHVGGLTDLDALRKPLLARAKRVDIPDVMYRIDPVSRGEKALDFLFRHKLMLRPGDAAAQGAKRMSTIDLMLKPLGGHGVPEADRSSGDDRRAGGNASTPAASTDDGGPSVTDI